MKTIFQLARPKQEEQCYVARMDCSKCIYLLTRHRWLVSIREKGKRKHRREKIGNKSINVRSVDYCKVWQFVELSSSFQMGKVVPSSTFGLPKIYLRKHKWLVSIGGRKEN